VQDLALQAVCETPAGLRQEAGDRPVGLLPALGVWRLRQTADWSPEPVRDRRRASAEETEIPAVRCAGHWTSLLFDTCAI
jgi:hypothetical protein